MDTIAKALICFLCLWSASANAVTPANVVRGSYCYSDPIGVGACKNGVKFDDAGGAAFYACQRLAPASAAAVMIVDLKQHPLSMAGGLNTWGKFYWSFVCTYTYQNQGYTMNQGAGIVTAEPDCGSALTNYSPASCAGGGGGSGTDDPPVACVNTQSAIIPAFHMVPVSSIGCYAGCLYTAVNTSIVEWNGGTYESGTWSGNGSVCAANDIALFGGAPGNSQDVAGGGLSPGDLVNLAKETTLQSVLSAIQAGSTLANSNQTILERIASATESAANQPAPTAADPDGLEAAYLARAQAVQVDANGRLPDSALNAQTVDVGGTFSNVQGFLGAGSCPIAPAFTIKGKSYAFDLTILCALAQGLSYLVVALASLAGVKIFLGGL